MEFRVLLGIVSWMQSFKCFLPSWTSDIRYLVSTYACCSMFIFLWLLLIPCEVTYVLFDKEGIILTYRSSPLHTKRPAILLPRERYVLLPTFFCQFYVKKWASEWRGFQLFCHNVNIISCCLNLKRLFFNRTSWLADWLVCFDVINVVFHWAAA